MVQTEFLQPSKVDDHEPGAMTVDRRGGQASREGCPASDSPLIDVGCVAALLSCSTKHVRRMADAGRCPAPIRLGGLVRWNRKVVQDWIAAGCPPVRTVRLSARR